MKSVTFLIDEEQLKRLDELVGYYGFKDRSDAIRKLLKFALENPFPYWRTVRNDEGGTKDV